MPTHSGALPAGCPGSPAPDCQVPVGFIDAGRCDVSVVGFDSRSDAYLLMPWYRTVCSCLSSCEEHTLSKVYSPRSSELRTATVAAADGDEDDLP